MYPSQCLGLSCSGGSLWWCATVCAVVLTACGCYTLHPVFSMCGMSRHDCPVWSSRSYKDFRYLCRRLDRFIKNVGVWWWMLCGLEALQEVSTLSTQCTQGWCCPRLWFYVPRNAKLYHAHGWMTFPRNCLAPEQLRLHRDYCVEKSSLAPGTINDYMCCVHEGEPRLNGINKWLWN